MIEPWLLEILACPETQQPVTPAEKPLVDSLNAKIEQKALTNRSGKWVTERLDGGLVRQDRKYLYPIREGIPVMLMEESIPL